MHAANKSLKKQPARQQVIELITLLVFFSEDHGRNRVLARNRVSAKLAAKERKCRNERKRAMVSASNQQQRQYRQPVMISERKREQLLTATPNEISRSGPSIR